MKLVEREDQRPTERQCLLDRFRGFAKEPRHLGRGLEIALGIDGEPPPGPVDRQVLADAGEDVLQFPPVGMMIEHVVDGDERHAGLPCDPGTPCQPRTVIAAIEHVGGQPHAAGGGSTQKRKQLIRFRDGFSHFQPAELPSNPIPGKGSADDAAAVGRSRGIDDRCADPASAGWMSRGRLAQQGKRWKLPCRSPSRQARPAMCSSKSSR
jgi:hypothetical protein